MPTARLHIAKLNQAKLGKINALEKKLGHSIVALEPYFPPAALVEKQIKQLKALERDLGVVLLAYKT
jgi:hypothetical protein